jgi:hypothetical protein
MYRTGGLMLAGLALAVLTGSATAAKDLDVAQHLSGVEKFNPKAETIRLFDGVKAGQLEVGVTAEGANRCRFQITNTTKSPLNVVMPGAFAAVPVTLANLQEDPAPPEDELPPPEGEEIPPPEGDDMPPPDDPQKLGIGCPYVDDGSGLNTFCFIPGRTARLQLRSVCLEHDRAGPSPKHHYVVKPMDEVTTIKGVYEICSMMGRGEIDHQIAQTAAWYLNNQISWKQLWNESQHGAPGMGGQRGMTRQQLWDAINAVDKALGRSWSKMTSLGRSAESKV